MSAWSNRQVTPKTLCKNAGWTGIGSKEVTPLNPDKPDCIGVIEHGHGGGIVCPVCHAWFCF